MRSVLPALLLLATVAAPARAAWTDPQRVGPRDASTATLAFTPAGTGWTGWSRGGRYDHLQRLGGERAIPTRRFDRLAPWGRDGIALLADDGARLRLKLGLRGRWTTVARRHDALHGPFLLSGPGGRIAVVWSDFPRRPRSENGHRLLAVVVRAGGRPGAPQTIAHVLGGVGNAGTDVAVAFGPRGELVAVYERRERRGYGLWTRTRAASGRLNRPQRIGESHGNSRMAVAVGRGGRMVAGWASEDGGEERNRPRIYRAAVRTRRGARFAVKRVDVAHQLAFEYPEAVAATTEAVVWSGERDGDGDLVEFPVRSVPIAADGTFGAVQEIAPSGEVAGVATVGGTLLTAWWHVVEDPEQSLALGALHATTVRPPGGAVAPPEQIDPDAGSSKLAIDPSSGAAWLLYVSEGGAFATRYTE